VILFELNQRNKAVKVVGEILLHQIIKIADFYVLFYNLYFVKIADF